MTAIHVIDKQPEDDIPGSLTPEVLREQTEGLYAQEVEEFAVQESELLGLEPNFEGLETGIIPHIEQYGAERVVMINETTQAQLQNIIRDAQLEGVNPRRIARDIGEYVTDIIPNRGEVIARTEMLRASNFGTFQAHKTSGVVERREWIATPDGRARDWHHGDEDALDGVVVAIDEPFTSPETGAQAMYPGGFGPAIDVIQCRCTTGAITGTRHVPSRDVQWKQFDEALEQSERTFAAQWRRAFRVQLSEQLVPAVEEAYGVDISRFVEELK